MKPCGGKYREGIITGVLICVNALILVLLTLMGNAVSIDRDGTGALMKNLDIARQIYVDRFLDGKTDSHADITAEFLPVNIGYDRELVMAVDEFGIPVGERPVVNRERLVRFLKAIEGAPYKSIIIDVQFFKADAGESDSTLFATINRMPGILVSDNDDDDAEDAILPAKLASSEYNTSFDEDNFVKYRYHHDGVQDMALATYNIRNNSNVNLNGFFPTDNGRLASGCLALRIPYKFDSGYDADGEKTYYNLGADLLDVYSAEELAELVKGKTIVIGDYTGGDDHDTYTGSVAGPLIIINAVVALEQHRHLINWWWMVIFFILYVLLTLMLIIDPARLLPGRLGESNFWNLIITGLGFGTVILAINIIKYFCTGVMYELYFPTLWLTAQYFIKDNFGTIKRWLGIPVRYIIRYIKRLFRKSPQT